jgi:hypothetical protein
MPAWGNYDNAANTPLWSATAVNVSPTAPNTANLFQNVTVDYWKDTLPNGGDRLADVAIGVFGVDANEADVNNKGAHTGWVLRTAGTGGRAGRVQQEVLVAMSSIITDNTSPYYPDATITISSQPAGNTANTILGNTATFRVTASITEGNTAAPLTYQWYSSNTVAGTYGWTEVADNTPANTSYTGETSAALVITPTYTDADNYGYRVVVSATGTEATANSTAAKLDVV